MQISIGHVAKLIGQSEYMIKTYGPSWGLTEHMLPSGHRRYDLEQVQALAQKFNVQTDLQKEEEVMGRELDELRNSWFMRMIKRGCNSGD